MAASFTFDTRLEKGHRFIEAGLRGRWSAIICPLRFTSCSPLSVSSLFLFSVRLCVLLLVVAILSTQSNDFAFGLPVLTSLYSSTHPEFPLMLYVIAPISLVILNPIAFLFCEYGYQGLTRLSFSHSSLSTNSPVEDEEGGGDPLSNSDDSLYSPNFVSTPHPVTTPPISLDQESPQPLSSLSAQPSTLIMVLNVIKEVVRNPVVLMTFLGLLTNCCLHSQPLPTFLHDWLGGLGGLFGVSSLFLMGANMADTGGILDAEYIYATSLTIACKNLLLPIVSYFFVTLLGGNADLSTYAFIVGAFPVGKAFPGDENMNCVCICWRMYW